MNLIAHWLLLLISSIFLAILQDKESQSLDFHTLDYTIIDHAGNPVVGAEIYESLHTHWLRDPSQPIAAPLATTDRSGHFRIKIPSKNPFGVYAVSKGKVVELLTEFGDRPLRVQLREESKTAVIVYDENERPIEGAKVSPSTLGFPYSNRHYFVSPSVAKLLEATTDATGRAMLHGDDVGGIDAVQVDLGDGDVRNFELPENLDRTAPIVLHWNSFRGSLRVRIVDHQNQPVPNAPITVTSLDEHANPLVIQTPTISYFRCGQTDDQGVCTFDHVTVREVKVSCSYSEQDHRGMTVESKPTPIRRNEISRVELKFLPTKVVEFSILDASEIQPHAGVSVLFRKSLGDDAGRIIATGTTGEEGTGRVILEVGTWEVDLLYLERPESLPKGYVLASPATTIKFSITQESDPQPVPPIMIAKGRTIKGSITGVDLAELRSTWLFATILDPFGTQREYWGTCQLNGNFEITIPAEATDEQIEEIWLKRPPLKKPGKLSIVSRSPWHLGWKED